MRPAVRHGFIGPALAVLFAAALGILVVHRYGAERASIIGNARSAQAAAWLLTHGPAGVHDLRRSESIRWAGVLHDVTPPGARYAFLRRPVWLEHTDVSLTGTALSAERPDDKAAADLMVLPAVTALPDGGFRAGAAEVLSPGERRAAVVELAPPKRVALPWPGLALSVLGALFFWFDLTRRAPASRGRPVVCAAATAAALLAILGPRLAATYALEVPETRATADITGVSMLLAGAILFPLVVAGVFGAMRGSPRSPNRLPYAYVAPALIGLGVLVALPFLYGIGLAFTRQSHGVTTFVGLENFVSILSSEGRRITEPLSFYFTLVVTLAWTAVNVVLHAGIGLGLALMLNRPTMRFKGLYRVLLIIPWAIPSYITALIWKGMFHQQYGIVNHLLGVVGISPVSWFSEFLTSFTANVVTNTWLGFPFMMVVSLGALQSIPTDLYEAAAVDGANKWQQFKHITLPLLRPALVPALILGSVWTFNMFNIIYLVSGGQPNHSTDILITQAYRWAFEQDRYGYAAAYSVLIFLILLIWSFFTQRLTRSAESQV